MADSVRGYVRRLVFVMGNGKGEGRAELGGLLSGGFVVVLF